MQTNCGLYKPKLYSSVYSFQQLFLKRLAIGCMVLTAFFAVAVIIRDASTDKLTAYNVAQGFVAERLLRPSSAKFPPRSTYEVTVKYLGRQRYFVAGYLESLNTFSNWQRSSYTCVIRYIGGGEWTCEKITFE